MVKSQPGFYRMMLGEFEVTALNDGVVPYPTSRVFPSATPEQIKERLYASGLNDPVGMSYNAFLINTGSKLVLIDTGTGGKLADQPDFRGAGHVVANLRAAGYRPEQIDEVYITHHGPDHVGGLTAGTTRVFQNATVRVPATEFAMFLDKTKATGPLAAAIQDLFEPYIKADRFKMFDKDVQLVPGIRSMGTHGHTPGHTSYVVESRGKTLIVMGDLVHVGALQFAYPSLSSSFDADPKAAAEQRLRIFEMATDGDYWLAGGHLPFPGIGHVRAAEDRFSWVPGDYSGPL